MSNLAMVKFRGSTGAQRKEFFESAGWKDASGWVGHPALELRKGDYRIIVNVDDTYCSDEYVNLHQTYTSWIELEVPPVSCLFEVNLMAHALLDNGLFHEWQKVQACP